MEKALKISFRKNKDSLSDEDKLGVAKYLNEFDIKDIVDIGNGESEFGYSLEKE
jgi:hypothetical protein